jgi:acyl-CoA thioester hydrolase
MEQTITDLRDQFKLWVPIAVRWGDMDSYGHVNNAKYFTYCESARLAYFERFGIHSGAYPPHHKPALVQASLNFRSQVVYPADLEVGARVPRIGVKSFTIDLVIVRSGTGEIVADGTSVIAWGDYQANRAIPLPQSLVETIRALEGLRE